jgi:aminopeptidase N
MYDASITGNPRVLRKRVAEGIAEYFQKTARKGDQALLETDPYRPVGAVQEILYEKGAVVLHMLRHQVGDAAFLKILRGFADRHRFGKAKIEDFRKIAEEQSGQELDWFFDQWLGRTGGMALTYSFKNELVGPRRYNLRLKVTQPEPAYRAKLKLAMDVGDRAETGAIELAGRKEQEFVFPVPAQVKTILFDPENIYLMKPPRWIVEGG